MKQIDTAYQVETPEGVILKMRAAGLPARFYAYIIDLLFKMGFHTIVIIPFSLIGWNTFYGFFLIYLFIMEWFYPVYFEVYRNGKTPGKKTMRLKVLNGDGTPIGLQASIIRNFLLSVDIYFFGFISCLIDRRFRRLGDLAGDTIVVYEKETVKAELPDTEPVTPPVNLTIDEQKAIIAFAENSKILSDARKKELAEIINCVHEEKHDKAVEAVISYASALSGKVGK